MAARPGQRVEKNLQTASTVFHIEIAGGRIFVATNKGLYRSIDGGDSYQPVPLPSNAAGTAPATGDFANFVTDVRAKPGTPDQITAAIGWRAGKANSPGNGLYRSTTGGGPGSFHRMNTMGLGLPNDGGDPVGRISLAYTSGPNQNHNIMWAVVQDPGKQRGDTLIGQQLGASYTVLNGVFQSANDGLTWNIKALPEQLIAAPGTAMTVRAVTLYAPGVQAWYNQWIAVDPGDADTVLFGLEEIYKSVANANGLGPGGVADDRPVLRSVPRTSDADPSALSALARSVPLRRPAQPPDDASRPARRRAHADGKRHARRTSATTGACGGRTPALAASPMRTGRS